MYIVITDDGQILSSRTCSKELLKNVDAGVVKVIDISNPASPKDYYDGHWSQLDEMEETFG